MSVRVRLTRVGSKKNPIWRVVVTDQRSPRDGRSIETLGHYNPQTEPSTIVIDRERLDYWVKKGAQPTGTVKKLLRAPNTEAAPPRAAPVQEAPEPAAEAPAPEPDAPEAEAAPQETVSEPDPEAPTEDAPAEPETDETGSEPDPEAPAPESA